MSSIRQMIKTSKAAMPLASYNQAVKANGMVYLSGMIGMDKSTNKLVQGGLDVEARQVLTNMKNVLEAADSGFDKLVKITVMLNDINDFATFDGIYKEFVKPEFPARVTFQAVKLPGGSRVEIDAIGLCGDVQTEIVSS